MKNLGKSEKIDYKNVDKNTGEEIPVTSSGLKFRKRSGWKLQPYHMETVPGPTMATQKQSFDIRDLLRKGSRGLDLVPEFQPLDFGDQTHDDPDYSQVQRMDIFDQQQLLQDAKIKAKSAETKITDHIKKVNDLKTQKEKGAVGETVPPPTT